MTSDNVYSLPKVVMATILEVVFRYLAHFGQARKVNARVSSDALKFQGHFSSENTSIVDSKAEFPLCVAPRSETPPLQ